MRLAILTVTAVLGTQGCSSPTQPPPPGAATYAVAPLSPWAGGTVRITSEALRGIGDDAGLRLGLATFPLQRLDDTTLSLVVPSTAGGVYDPVLVLGDSLILLDQIIVSGFLDGQAYGPRFIHDVYPRSVAGNAGVMGGTLDRAFVVIDLESFGVSTTVGNALDFSRLRGPGATPDPEVVLLRPLGGEVASWRLDGVPHVVEMHPEVTAARGNVARLGPQTWYLSHEDRLEVWHRETTTDPFTIQSTPATEAGGIRISPRGDRAAVRVGRIGDTEPGVPVFGLPGGEVAYHLPLRSVQDADWSADGGLLAVVGGATAGAVTGSVLLLDAGSGAVRQLATTTRPVFSVAFDARRPLVYVGTTTESVHPAVLVYDRETLALLGEMRVQGSQPTCGQQDCRGGLVVVAADYLFVFWSVTGPARAYRFLLPDQAEPGKPVSSNRGRSESAGSPRGAVHARR
jgi:hypothetical protein